MYRHRRCGGACLGRGYSVTWLIRTIVIAAVFLALPVSLAAALPPYPEPPPDFAHPGTPHNGDPIYGPVGGNDDRPLLVVLVTFPDAAAPAGRDAAFFQNMIFGGFPSLTGYFNANSFGDFLITPAAETEGTANDGIVSTAYAGTYASFIALSEEAQNRATVQLADPFVNFASFDANNDGSVGDDELILLVIRAAVPTPTDAQSCGATRAIAAAPAHPRSPEPGRTRRKGTRDVHRNRGGARRSRRGGQACRGGHRDRAGPPRHRRRRPWRLLSARDR